MPRVKTVFLILVVIFLAGYTGGIWGGSWYLEIGNTYLHFAGGLFMGLLVATYYRSEFAKLSQPFRFFCLVGIVIGIGVMWEFHEFILNQVFNSLKFQGDNIDTMKDLLMDTLGGMAAAVLYSFRGRNP